MASLSKSLTRRDSKAVDAGLPISDLIRDPRTRDLSDDAISSEIRHRWQSCIDASRDLRLRQWVRNVLMTYGEQDIHWSQRADRWLTVEMRRIRRYKTNLLPSRVAYFAARMTQSAPEWTSVPYNDTVEAEQASRFCDKLLRYSYREMHMDLARYFSVIQMCIFGLGIQELVMDDEAEIELDYEQEKDAEGRPVFDPTTGVPVYKEDKDGKPIIKDVRTKAKFKCRPVTPFAFVVPPGMEWPLLDDAPYCIRASWLSEQYIRRRFDIPQDVVLGSDSYGNYEAMTSYLWQVLNPQTLPVNRFEAGRLLVLQYYERAKDVKGFYEGKVYTVVGNHLVGSERSLWDDGRYPFFLFPWLPVTDSFYPYPWLNPQVDPQSRINQTTTHLMDHLARVGSPNIIADRQSGFPKDAKFAYQIYYVSPGMRRPEFMQAPTIPTGAYQMLGQAKQDMDQASSSYPPARGENQPGITSGLHARLLQDADQTEMGPVVRMHAASFARMGESLLELYRLYERTDKMLSIIGEDGEPELFDFRSSKVPVRQRVMVQEDSLLVHYRSAMVEQTNQIAAAGAFGNLATDADARQRYLKALRDPHLAGPLTPEMAQRQYIDQIHYRIIHKGEQPEVEPWWDLNAHREAAQLRLLRESLRWDEETKGRFMQFWQAIEEAASKLQQEQTQQQQAMAQQQVDMQGQVFDKQAQAKAKLEYLRSVGKLTVESMKQGGNGAGAGSGAAALGASAIVSEAAPQGQQPEGEATNGE